MKKQRMRAAADVDAMLGKLAQKVSRRARRKKLGQDPDAPGPASELVALDRLMRRVAAKAALRLRRGRAGPLA